MTPEKSQLYESSFNASSNALLVLRNGRIISNEESPSQMVERVVNDLASVESHFLTPELEKIQFTQLLGEQVDAAKIVFSTPIMTNAYKDEKRPLSACTVPPIDLSGDLQRVKAVVDTYHQEAMGTGFDLTYVDNPVETLLFLNEVAVSGSKSGKEDRPVGNMATCRVDHPRIFEFITAKVENSNLDWKFNISVDTPQSFWDTVDHDGIWELRDGTKIKSRDLLHLIAKSAYICADPGIVSLDRLNADNPTPGVGLYTSTAPCAEVGLVPGETCQFGYINLAKFIDQDNKSINYEELAESAHLLTRALDNALELSIDRYTIRDSANIMSLKRKIGVGICGLADMMVYLGIPYDSNEARELSRDVVSFINFQTKLASVELARSRGSFEAMNLIIGNRYIEDPSFIEAKYGNLETRTVSAKQWINLATEIRSSKLLRNSTTVALPPTGRSGLVIDASTGVEPLFTLNFADGVHPALQKTLDALQTNTSIRNTAISTGSCQNTSLDQQIKDTFKTATEIDPLGHIKMVSAILPCVDESVSKTINLPEDASVKDIVEIYSVAYKAGLKGITIYRDGSSNLQPRKVAKA